MASTRTFVTLAVAVVMSASARSQPAVDPNSMVQQTIVGEHDCSKKDWQFAVGAESSGLLKSEILPTNTCRAVTLSWLPSAQIVQVTGWQHTDVFVYRTVVRANQKSPLRVITALGGLVVRTEWEKNPKNIAAFNELLAAAPDKPKDDESIEIAALYLFMVGHSPDERLRKLADVAVVNDMMGFTQRSGDLLTVELHQRTSPLGSGSRPEWILKFRDYPTHLKLVSVAPKTS